MKKLIVFIGIALISAGTFGQRSPETRIYGKSSEIYRIAGLQKMFPKTTIRSQSLLNPYQYIIGNEVFILSYDTLQNGRFDKNGQENPEYRKEITNRPVYFFRYDSINSIWVKATSSPIQYDNPDDFYYDGISEKRGRFINDGKIAILLTNMLGSTGGRYIKIIVLTPIRDKQYSSASYGTLNTGKIPYDYLSMLSQLKDFEKTLKLVTNGEIIKFKKESF
jgi:hypothetical protein